MPQTARRPVLTMLLRLFRIAPYLGVLRRLRRGPERLFDPEYYLASNPDVAGSRIPPLAHFVLFGGFEGRKPNLLFDPRFYRRTYRDVADAEINPLLHYLKSGWREGRKPHPLFDPDSGRDDSLARFLAALDAPDVALYGWWMRQQERKSPPALTRWPRFSLLMAVSDVRRDELQAAVGSVRGQSYPHWELCICCDGPDRAWLREYVDAAANSDARIRVVHMESRVQASVALNRAAAMARGDYVTVLDPRDRLTSDALHWLAAKDPAELIYSDEDRLDASGARVQPLLKPDWSPDLLLSSRTYVGRMMAVSRAAWERCGGFRPERDGAREYDLALRVTEQGGRIEHVARVLYSRGGEAGVAKADARRALQDAIGRRGLTAEIEPGVDPGTFRVRWKARPVLVSVIVCSRSAGLLDRCLGSLARTGYECREVVVVQHMAGEADELEGVIARHGAKRVTYSGPFHFSRMNNLAAEAANGEILLFLNDDTEILEPSWLDRLVGQVERPDIGVAGARLLYPSGALQHGGVAIGVADGAAHAGRNMRDAPPHWPWLDCTRDISAVTGACLAVRAAVFHELGGFAEEFPVNYNDIDLCLRAREAGYRVIYEAGAILRHYECQSRQGVITPEERRRWEERWRKVMDPFYSRNLTVDREDLSLAIS